MRESKGITATASSPTERPGSAIGPYKLLQEIGEGGFGVVYMAEQEQPVRRRVALKIIKLGMDTKQVIARFEAERQALAMMEHPNIARVLDAGATENGRPYFVMELIRGIPIVEYCDANSLTTRERLDLFIGVCSALQHAHQKGVVHRDIKPSNVMVTLHDGEPVPKVIDFGIAKAMQQRLTEKTLFTEYGQFIGTPAYMSPEQAGMSGLDVDTRSDIYSLGVLLYELLTGTTPFEAESLRSAAYGEIQRIIREDEPPRPSTRLSTLGGALTDIAKHRNTDPGALARLIRGDLDWITMKALEKNRSRRYGSASELAADIGRHLTNEAVLARPPSTGYRARKFVRRHRVGVGVAGLLVGVLVAGIAVSTLVGLREATLRREATWRSYVANIVAAESSLRLRDSAGAKRRLSLCPPELRGWEWFYFQDIADQSEATLAGHEGAVVSLALSPDGTRIASGSAGNTVRLWDAASGELLTTLTGHENWVLSVAFSPDGKRIASGSVDNTVRLWDAASGEPLVTLEGHEDAVWTVAFSADGSRIASGSVGGIVRVWDAAAGELLATLAEHEYAVSSVAFSPDGSRIASGSEDNDVRVWDAVSSELLATLEGHASWVSSVAFSPDGRRIASGSADEKVLLWDATSGELLATLAGHEKAVRSVAFSPDGTRIASASEDRTVRLWDAALAELVETDATIGGRGTLVIRNSEQALLATLTGHEDTVLSVVFTRDGTRIASASEDETVRLWRVAVAPGDMRGAILARHEQPVLEVAFSPDGKRIASASMDNTPRLWDAASGEMLATLVGHENLAGSVAFSPDGTRIVSGSWDQTVRLWDSVSGELMRTLTVHESGVPSGRTHLLPSVAFSPDGTRIVSVSWDKTARLWDAASGDLLRTLKGHQSGVSSVVFSPDGARIAGGAPDGSAVRLWDSTSGESLTTLKGPEDAEFSTIAFSPDGTQFAGSSTGNTVRLWDAASGDLLMTLWGHENKVSSVAFSPDGTRIVSGSWDQTVRLWDAASGELLATLTGHEDALRSVAFSPDGKRIASGSQDKTVRLW